MKKKQSKKNRSRPRTNTQILDGGNFVADNADTLPIFDDGDEKKSGVSRGIRRKHLDERLRSLNQRALLIETELRKLEGRFYRTCVFGSARIKPKTKAYTEVEELARLLAQEGIDVLTGGGPGLMEAANKGAQDGISVMKNRAKSYGISIQLDFEPIPNSHLDVKRHHLRFSSRLDDFMRLSNSIIVTPGGIGTCLELFFTWQLIQVKHLSERPIILMGERFWSGLITWMRDLPLSDGLISPKDFDMINIVDTPVEAFELVKKHHNEFLKNRPNLEAISKKI